MCIFCSLAGVAPGGLGCSDSSGMTGTNDHTALGASDASAGATLLIASASTSFSPAQIIQQLRTQWGGSFEGSTLSWSGTGAIDYFIGGTPYPSGSGEIAFKTGMTALMQSRATLAFELWDDLIARDLNPASSAASAQIQFEYATRTNDGTGALTTSGGTYSSPWISGNGTNSYGTANYRITRDEIWLNSNWTSHNADNDMFYGGYGFQTYMHEIGHALGLSHPGSYNAGSGGSITYANNAEYSLDNRQYTIMSYFGGYQPGVGWQQDGTSSSYLYSSTPMRDDVAAIQAIYGADTATRAGDTTYGFHSNAGREVFDFTIDLNPIVTVWDAGGTDTLDFSGYSSNQRIDLRAGTYSDVGSLFNNFAIAFNVIIENATGGSGNDSITGNDAGNAFRGNAGNDSINGMGGIDYAYFSGARAAYTVTPLGPTSVRVAGPDGIDTLINVEWLVVGDQTVAGQDPSATQVKRPSDFNGDSTSDILLQSTSGAVSMLQMAGNQILSSTTVASPAASWHAAGVADFNGDGRADVFMQNDNGFVSLWQMDGSRIDQNLAVANPGPQWHVVGTGDFNGDGKGDALLRHDSGFVSLWEMNGNQIIGNLPIANPGTQYHVGATGDFDGDGHSDLLLRHDNGFIALWKFDGDHISSNTAVANPGSQYHIAGTGDFDGDGHTDILMRHDNGFLALWLMNGDQIVANLAVANPGPQYTVAAIADYNGDGRSDIVMRHTSGFTALWEMTGAHIDANLAITTIDPAWKVVPPSYELL